MKFLKGKVGWRLLSLLILLLVGGCGEIRQVDAEIVKVPNDDTAMGCVGTDSRTVFRTEEGYTDYLCGDYGTAGDKVKGFWMTGHWDAARNGFSLTN